MKKIILLFVLISSVISLHAQIPPNIPTNGLMGYWPFNGNANDESGNNNHGTVNGATPTTDRFGVSSKAYYFNGSSYYIEVPSSGSLCVSSAYSILAWAEVYDYTSGGFPNQYAIASKIDNGDWYGGYEVRAETPDYLVTTGNIGGQNTAIGEGGKSTYQWYCVIVTYDGQKLRFYVDAVCKDSADRTGSLQTSSIPLRFGRRGGAGGFNCWFNGKIDDIGIWNRALTFSEIQQIYANCTVSVTSNPATQTVNDGAYAEFAITASGTGNTYQWQQDTGTGYFNLSNSPPYSGTDDDTLHISSADISMDNASFRCIASAGVGCADTSSAAKLYICNKTLVFNQALLVSSQQTVPANKVWKVESALGQRVSQYNYRSRNDADFNPADCKIKINGIDISVANTTGTGAGHGSGDAGGSTGFSYSATPTKFPFWIPEGTTLAASSNVSFISIIEFNLVSP